MIADIRKQIARVPFEPFSIRTSDGHEYPVPTVDHIYITPTQRRIVVADDEGVVVLIPVLHISRIRHKENGAV
jgi:hypothetical protein